MSPQAPKPPAPSPPPDRRLARDVAKHPPPDRRLARDVAKHLDRRRLRRRVMGWLIVLGAVVLGALYLTCGRGFGLGKGAGQGAGKGPGSGPGPGSVNALLSPVDAGPSRCQIRIAAAGITAAGKPATVDEALAACKDATAAEVLVTGGARAGDWEDLKAAFDRAGIQILRAEPRGAAEGSADEPRAGGSSGAGSDTSPTGSAGSGSS